MATRVEEERGVDALSLCDFDSDSDSDSGEEEQEEEKDQEVKSKCGRKEKMKRKGRTTHWQQQSPLFALPLEIRNRVYEECIGGYTIHISTLDAYHRMAHTRCKTPPLSTLSSLSSTCACGFLARQKGMVDQWGNTSLLHLLGTCRRMYVLSCSDPFSFPYLPYFRLHLHLWRLKVVVGGGRRGKVWK